MRYIVLLLILNLLHSILPAQQDDPIMQIRGLLINEKYEDLLSVTDSLTLPDSMKAELNYYRGQAFRELSMHDCALHSFQQALTGDSSNISYSKAVGKAYHSLGRTREAILVFEDVLAQDSMDRKLRLDLAGLYMVRKQYMKSLGLYRHLLESDSLNYFLYKQAGKCYLAIGPPDSVLYYFEKAFQLNPADPYLTQQIANIYLDKEQFDKSLATVQKGMEHDTSNSDLLRLRGYIWYLHDNYSLAIRDLEASASRDSNSAFTYKYLGLAFLEENRFHESRAVLLRAYKLDSLDTRIILSLGSTCRWSKHEKEAIQYYQKVFQLFQSTFTTMKTTHTELAEIYIDLEQFDNAIESYHEALTIEPLDNVLIFQIAQVYDQYLDQKRMAIEYYEKYLSGKSVEYQMDDLKDPRSKWLLEYVQSRINFLKEELFFEE